MFMSAISVHRYRRMADGNTVRDLEKAD